MTKHRSVVTGWDPDHVNPDDSTGRPKGVQTAPDMRIATTFDVLGEGIFAKYGVPAITGSPTDSASISPFMAAITSPSGGFYVVSIDAATSFTINLANTGAFKVYVQQKDYEVNAADVDSDVVIGVVYGATAIPYNSLLLFTGTIASQTSTSGLTFTKAFKYTGAASGFVRVPTKTDLANVTLIQTGIRALVTSDGTSSNNGEYFYTGSVWQVTSVSNVKLDAFLSNNVEADGSYKDGSVKGADIDYTTLKTFMPDYANMEATNRWAATDTYTVPARGFVYAYIYGYTLPGGPDFTPQFLINNKLVMSQSIEQTTGSGAKPGTTAIIYPVAAGDVVKYTTNGNINGKDLRFIPGRWV